MAGKELFWSDQIARKITSRKKFHYIDRPQPKLKTPTVKTSASLSGVLHIGRLSDTIRAESVYLSLKDREVKARLIWVAEDMDPLRKVPKGVPARFSKYIGVPVTDIPDPYGCHKSYADHHKSTYLKVLGEFVRTKMKIYSMREEYKKKRFRPYISKLLDNVDAVREIQNKYRDTKLPVGWSPWSPICQKCGKVITPRVTGFREGLVEYICKDYRFEKTVAKGCGYKGTADPLKDDGKLMWKSEWAAQWVRWQVVSEGGGKEYQVPGSAFWINGEIAEKVFGFPMPEPIFYEHIMIDGVKMSASLGNVVYPKDWLESASPEILRFFYNKKLMKTRSFSWGGLPNLYDEYDLHARVFAGEEKVENRKEREHMKRLYGLSRLKAGNPIGVSFAHASNLVQMLPDESAMIKSLKKTGHYKGGRNAIAQRLRLAGSWVELHAPEEYKLVLNKKVPSSTKRKLSKAQREALSELAARLEKRSHKENELFDLFREISTAYDMKPLDFYRAAYLALLNKDRGPRLAGFILMLGRKRVAKILRTV